jgi:hypothetical protein
MLHICNKEKEHAMGRGNPNWQKGKSANPAGRPRGTGRRCWNTFVRDCKEKYGEVLKWQHPDLGIEITDPDEMAYVQLTAAVQNGESWAIQIMLERSFGKPLQALDVDMTTDAQSPFAGMDNEALKEAIAALRAIADSGAGKGTSAASGADKPA